MLKYKDIVYNTVSRDFYQVVNVGKKSYTLKDLTKSNNRPEKNHKAACHALLAQKVWVIGHSTTLKLLYGKV